MSKANGTINAIGKIITYILVVLLVLGIAGGISYFVLRNQGISLRNRQRAVLSFLCAVDSSSRCPSCMVVAQKVSENDKHRPRERKQALERLQEAV